MTDNYVGISMWSEDTGYAHRMDLKNSLVSGRALELTHSAPTPRISNDPQAAFMMEAGNNIKLINARSFSHISLIRL